MAEMNHKPITIVGCGPGGKSYLTFAGAQALAAARVLVGSRRLLETFADPSTQQIAVGADVDAALAAIEQLYGQGGVVVLVSGDPGISSLARPVIRRFGRHNCDVIPGISAIQAAFARLGVDWLDARLISAHGRIPQVTVAELAGQPKIAVLAGTVAAMQWAADLGEVLSGHTLYLCREMTLPAESIQQIAATQLRQMPATARTLILFIKEGDD